MRKRRDVSTSYETNELSPLGSDQDRMKDSDRPSYGREINLNTHPELSSKSSSKRYCCFAVGIFVTVVIILLGICGMTYYRQQVRKQEIKDLHAYMKGLVDNVNSSPKSRWKAKFNPFGMKNKDYNYKTLKNITAVKEYVKHLEDFFASEKMKAHLAELDTFPASQLPSRFDAREKWPLCPTLHHVMNQGGCGSCFAVSSITVASDRACIHSNATFKSSLSAEDVLGCCKVCGNCYGGDPLKALAYWVLEGIVTGAKDGCRPYTQNKDCGTPCLPDEYPGGEQKRQCLRQCQSTYYKNSYAEDKNFGSLAYTMFPRKMTVDQSGKEKIMMSSVIGHFNKTAEKPLTPNQIHDIIKKELYLFGPTTMAFPVTEEFLHYDSGIFHPVPEEKFEKRIIYWHVVRLIGWGRDSEDKLYWIAINSFGSQWGENGLFRIDTSMLEKFGLEYETGMPL